MLIPILWSVLLQILQRMKILTEWTVLPINENICIYFHLFIFLKEQMKKRFTFSPIASWMSWVSLDIFATISPVFVSLSKYAISCLSRPCRYKFLIRQACLSPVIVQHATSIEIRKKRKVKKKKHCSSDQLTTDIIQYQKFNLIGKKSYEERMLLHFQVPGKQIEELPKLIIIMNQWVSTWKLKLTQKCIKLCTFETSVSTPWVLSLEFFPNASMTSPKINVMSGTATPLPTAPIKPTTIKT